MTEEIAIQIERNNYGNWLTIHIPYTAAEKMFVTIQTAQGETLKKIKLTDGNNAIDISSILNQAINIKIETPYETILKKINLRTP